MLKLIKELITCSVIGFMIFTVTSISLEVGRDFLIHGQTTLFSHLAESALDISRGIW